MVWDPSSDKNFHGHLVLEIHMLSFPGEARLGAHPYSLSFPTPSQSLGDPECQEPSLKITELPTPPSDFTDAKSQGKLVVGTRSIEGPPLLRETEHQSSAILHPLGSKRRPRPFIVLIFFVVVVLTQGYFLSYCLREREGEGEGEREKERDRQTGLLI